MPMQKGRKYALDAPRSVTPAMYVLIDRCLATVTSIARVNHKWQLYFRVLWETGIRPGEGLNLTAQDISQGKLIVHRLKKKGHPADSVPIQLPLERALREYIRTEKIRPKGKLFPESIQGVHFIFNRVKQKLLLPDSITPHSFRHGFAMNVLQQAPPELKADAVRMLKVLQRMLAHENINTTAVYLETTRDEIEDILGKMKFRG